MVKGDDSDFSLKQTLKLVITKRSGLSSLSPRTEFMVVEIEKHREHKLSFAKIHTKFNFIPDSHTYVHESTQVLRAVCRTSIWAI